MKTIKEKVDEMLISPYHLIHTGNLGAWHQYVIVDKYGQTKVGLTIDENRFLIEFIISPTIYLLENLIQIKNEIENLVENL